MMFLDADTSSGDVSGCRITLVILSLLLKAPRAHLLPSLEGASPWLGE